MRGTYSETGEDQKKNKNTPGNDTTSMAPAKPLLPHDPGTCPEEKNKKQEIHELTSVAYAKLKRRTVFFSPRSSG